MPLTERHIAQGMRLVFLEGLASQTMATLTGGIFLTAYALQLGAPNTIVGLLAAIPFLAQLLQLSGIVLVERFRRRRRLAVGANALGRLCLLGVALGAFLPANLALGLLIVMLIVQASLGAIGSCSWNSWIRDLIPPDRLGGYFSRRLSGMTALGAALTAAAGYLIDTWRTGVDGGTVGIYAALFAFGAAAGLAGVGLLAVTPEPPMPPTETRAPLRQVLVKPFRDRNFRGLLWFLAAWSFAVNLPAPFFTIYMLTRLQMTMTEVMALVVLTQVTSFAVLPLWGRLADQYSNKSILAVCGPVYILCLLGWTFTTLPDQPALAMVLLTLLHALMGVTTAGVMLAAGNIALKLSPEGEATPYLAMSGMIAALASGFAPILGGAVADCFAAWQLIVTVHWTGPPSNNVQFELLGFKGWDFFFLFAFMIGIYSLHRLALVVETSEISKRELVRYFFLETRRGIYTVSSSVGLRSLTDIPAAELLRMITGEYEPAWKAQPVPEG